MWTCSCFPSASSHAWGRTAACLGTAQGIPFAREIPRRSTKPVLQSTLLLEKHKPESEPENEGSIFLHKVYFLTLLTHNCSAQRDSKPRPWLQEMEWGTELWRGPGGDAHSFLTLFKAMSANLTEKGDLEVRRVRSWGGNSSVSWERWTFSSTNPWAWTL